MAIRHDTSHPRSSLWGNDHVGDLDDLDDVSAGAPTTDDLIQWSGSAWVARSLSAVGVSPRRVTMRVGITDPPEPVSNVNGDGWVYAEVS